MKSFLFANIPLSVLHFILFAVFRGSCSVLGQPGYLLAGALGASAGGVLWWAIMVLNSLVWGAVVSIVILPILRKLLK